MTAFEIPVATYGSAGLARYRLHALEAAGVEIDDPRYRAALGRWAARCGHEPPAEAIAFRAYWAEMLRYPLAPIPDSELDITPLTEEEPNRP